MGGIICIVAWARFCVHRLAFVDGVFYVRLKHVFSESTEGDFV